MKLHILIGELKRISDDTISCPQGTVLSNALISCGFRLPLICNGEGTCGKCKVRLLSGRADISEEERSLLTAQEREQGYRLACRLTVTEELDIELGLEEEYMYIPSADTSAENHTNTSSADRYAYSLAIDIGTTTLAIAAVDMRDGSCFDEYTCVNHQRSYGADVISRIAAACNGQQPAMRDCVIEDINRGIDTLMARSGLALERLEHIAITGNTVMEHIFAGYPCEGLGQAPFTPVSLELKKTDSGILLPGISAFVGADVVTGIYECGFADVQVPGAGGESDAADSPEGMHTADDMRLSLFIDLGTNGEIALGNASKLLVASTAAGPAFEGGNISCGTGTVPGAVMDVSLSDEEGEPPITLTLCPGAAGNHSDTDDDENRIIIVHPGSNDDETRTIIAHHGSDCDEPQAHFSPTGICGSGIIALAAELLRTGFVDETGLLDKRLGGRLKLTPGGEITFTQKDMRELQLAKAAIRAGIETLLFRYGATYEDITQVYIAGGFGRGINTDKAAAIGLIPKEIKGMVTSVGNTALKGAVRFLTDAEGAEKLEHIRQISTEVVLADDGFFKEAFVRFMDFS